MATKKKTTTTTTKKAPKPTAAKTAKKAKPAKAKKAAPAKDGKKLSQIDAAMRVLAEAKGPMNCRAMVEAMRAKGYWDSPNGKTPEATLYAAILRDLRKGQAARFVKADRGQFGLNK